MAPGSAAGQYAVMTEPPQQQRNIGESTGIVTVLLVDDSLSVRRHVSRLCSEQG